MERRDRGRVRGGGENGKRERRNINSCSLSRISSELSTTSETAATTGNGNANTEIVKIRLTYFKARRCGLMVFSHGSQQNRTIRIDPDHQVKTLLQGDAKQLSGTVSLSLSLCALSLSLSVIA